MDKKGQRSSNFENKQIDEVFWRRSFNELPTINEDNETLLFNNSSSSSSSSYKEVQNSVKIPKEEKDFTGNQVLSDSDTVEDFETEFQKNVDKQYFEKPNVQYDDDAASLASNFGSLEGLSLLNEEVCCVDQDEVSNVDDDNESLISIDKFILTLPVDDEIFYAHLPAINRDPTAAVPLQNIEKDFEDKLVYISEIFDPAHFWFQFVVGDEKFDNFDKFHAKLNDDYNKLKDRELLIADKNFQEGLIVVAYVKQYEKWFRAKIIKNYDGKKKYVRLFFIDYGTNGTCEKSNIRYLFNYFMKYPKYCFRGRLHGIVPLNNERSFEISQIEEFLKKISNYTTYATAIKYEAEDDVYQLKLVRRKRCIDMYEYMIEHKLGQNIFPWDNDGEFSIGPPCYLIPSFQNLEYDYPTYAQIAIMKKFEIDYNWLINSNHLLCYRRKDIEGNEDLKMLLKQPEFATLKDYFYGR